MTFQGASVLSLDAKGRLGVPARYRDALTERCAGNLVLTPHPHRCLLIYPAPDWEPIRKQILDVKGTMNMAAATLQRLLVGNALDEVMDANGRVLITQELRDWARLDKQVRLMGLGSHFELWSEEVWQALQVKAAEQFMSGEVPPGFENFVL
jgi:MraZ protein